MKTYQTTLTDETKNPVLQQNSFGRTGKYKKQDSTKIIEILSANNFELKETSYGIPRNKEKLGYQKHIMIFTRPDLQINEENSLQLLVTNSHDGSCSVKFDLGIFRTVCANGLVVGDSLFSNRVKHIGDRFEDRINLTLQRVLEMVPTIRNMVKLMMDTTLRSDQVLEFVKKAVNIRLKGIDNIKAIDYNTVAKVRRLADQKTDLYTIFNVIQENVIKGGIKYQTEKITVNEFNEETEVVKRNHTCRQIKGIDALLSTNKALWDTAMSFAA